MSRNRRIDHLGKKDWKRKECDSCKFYNQECRLGVCSIYPYKKKNVVVIEREVHDTG